MNIIDFLYNDKVNDLISKMNICDEFIIRSRNQVIRSTSSCRFWQFRLGIINYYIKNYSLFFENESLIMDLCNIVNSFIYDSHHINTPLYNIVVYNQPLNVTPIYSIKDLYSNYSIIQPFYMGIYDPNNIIIHFFTIIRLGETYYLNSSYGSEFVCVPQYTLELHIEEFNTFCYNLANKIPDFQTFYEKYFLKNNMKVRYNSNNIDIDKTLKSKYILEEEGISKEIKLIFESKNNYYVGLINNYETNIESLIENYIQQKKNNSFVRNTPMSGGKHKKKKLKSKRKYKRFKGNRSKKNNLKKSN